MKTARFFIYLSRVNALLIFGASLFGVAIAGFLAFELLGLGSGESEQAVAIEPKEEKGSESTPKLGKLESVAGTSFYRGALSTSEDSKYASYSSYGSQNPTVNYLFILGESLESRWLFPGNGQLILNSESVYADGDYSPFRKQEPRTTVAFRYHLIASDSNGDGQLSSKDGITVGYSRPDGRDFTTVLEGVERVIDSFGTSTGAHQIVVFEKNSRQFSALISIESFGLVKTSEIPPVE